MSALSDIVTTLLATPGSEHVLPHGLRLRYAEDAWHHLYLSRNRVYPSQTEVRTLMDVLVGLGVRGVQQRTDPSDERYWTIELFWADARQMALFEQMPDISV